MKNIGKKLKQAGVLSQWGRNCSDFRVKIEEGYTSQVWDSKSIEFSNFKHLFPFSPFLVP